jgi:hypothetical protein
VFDAVYCALVRGSRSCFSLVQVPENAFDEEDGGDADLGGDDDEGLD